MDMIIFLRWTLTFLTILKTYRDYMMLAQIKGETCPSEVAIQKVVK